MNKEYIIYARRSTDEAESQKNSLEYQEMEARKWCKSRGISISKDTIDPFIRDGVMGELHSAFKQSSLVFADGNVGYAIERPKFLQLVEWVVTEKKYAGIIVLCWDRVSRGDQSDLIVREMIMKYDCIRFVQGDFEKNSSGVLNMGIQGLFAQHHSRVTSEKVKGALKALHQAGKFPHPAPTGYLNSTIPGESTKEVDPIKGPLVKRMFELFGYEQMPMNEIIKWAAGVGLTTKPTRERRSRNEILRGDFSGKKVEKALHANSIRYILRNDFYRGIIPTGQKGIHIPLIDEPLWEAVDRRINGRSRETRNGKKIKPGVYRKIAKCKCGRIISPYEKKGHIYYGCMNGCRETCIREEAIHEQVAQILQKHIQVPLTLLMARLQDEVLEAGKLTPEKRAELLKSLAEEKQQSADRLAKARSFFMEGSLSKSDYEQERELHSESLKKIEKQEGVLSEKNEKLLILMELIELLQLASTSYKSLSPQNKRDLMHLVFIELIFDNKILSTYSLKDSIKDIVINRDEYLAGYAVHNRTQNSDDKNSLLDIISSLKIVFLSKRV